MVRFWGLIWGAVLVAAVADCSGRTKTSSQASASGSGQGGATAGTTNAGQSGASQHRGEGGDGGEGGEPLCEPSVWGPCCVREYDLTSYTGSTDGLCPASQVSHCDCDEGQAVIIVCAPDKSACLPQNGVCEPEVDCGWHQCGFEPEDEFCASLAEEVAAADENLTGPTACVRDIDCAAPELCVRRIYNMMFCADPETP